MKLTCVTAVFNAIKAGNRERLIRCVESVAKLKTEHEHLIYDGASTDGTVELLRELERTTPGLKVVSEPDTGIYNALNKGVRDAAGEWFYVLGCDDYIFPDAMDEVLALIVDNAAMIVANNVRSDDLVHHKIDKLFHRHIISNTPYCHQRVLMSMSTVKWAGGFDERYRIAADGDMMQKILHANLPVQYIDVVIAYYSAGGMSESDHALCYEERCRLVCENFKVDRQEFESAAKRGFMSVSTTVKCLFHRNYAIRVVGGLMMSKLIRYHYQNNFKPCLRIALYPAVVITRPLRHRRTS